MSSYISLAWSLSQADTSHSTIQLSLLVSWSSVRVLLAGVPACHYTFTVFPVDLELLTMCVNTTVLCCGGQLIYLYFITPTVQPSLPWHNTTLSANLRHILTHLLSLNRTMYITVRVPPLFEGLNFIV